MSSRSRAMLAGVPAHSRTVEAASLEPIEGRAYFDHASVGLLSPGAHRRAAAALALQASHGSLGAEVWNPIVTSARTRAARLIGASSAEISFAKNTPEAISRVASGLRWQPGDTVVVADCEFPANVYPWLNLRHRGVTVRWAHSHDGAVSLDALARALDRRTRLLSVSWVQFASGARVDLDTIVELCSSRGVRVLVDAIQGLGVVPLDVRSTPVDFVATSSHKWLRAPLGAGWLYTRAERLAELDLHEVGQGSMEPGDTFTSYGLEPRRDARRFESGVVPVASLAGLDGALEDLERSGAEAVSTTIRGLSRVLMEGLEARGHRLVTPRADTSRAGIVAFEPRSGDATTFVARLRQHGCVAAAREGWVRVAVHASNTHAEIERLLALA